MLTMFNKILHIAFFFALAATATAQNPYIQGNLQGGPPAPGTRSRSPLNSLERAANNLAGATILTDTFGNQRLALFVRIEDTCINYTPAATGNTQNLSAFVEKCSTDSVWYIDWEGKSQFIGGAGAVCDEDWLQITDNACPDAITDSIYHYRYAAIGARLVWPSAEFLVSDSSAAQVTVLSGNRNSRLAFWDNFNAVYSTIDQSGTSSVWYINPTGEMRWVTAGGGTPQVPGAPFVNQFAINPADLPLPTIQAHQYPNTRSDTATVRNFLYTDPTGEFRSQPIDSLVVIVVDSIQADTTLQRNWYTHNGVTTDLLRTALVKRSAWWRGIDSVGFFRFSIRPDLVDGTQVTMYQDSLVFDADTVLWRSTWHPALQFQDLGAESTYFHADSLKVVGIGQFPDFPNLNFDGTEKGYYYNPSSDGIVIIDGDGNNGGYAYINLFDNSNSQFLEYGSSIPSVGQVFTENNTRATRSNYLKSVGHSNNEFGYLTFTISQNNSDESYFRLYNISADTNVSTLLNFGSGVPEVPNRAFTIATNDQFFWQIINLPNDTVGNEISFYNRAYYWRNEHPTGVAGDTIFHYWAEDGVNAGKNPGFMTLDAICAHCSESAVNWYNSNGTTTDNTRIATVTETATWLSEDVVADGVYPFRFQLAGVAPNEPEMMVWRFPAPNDDSLTLGQSDQEIFFRSTNDLLLWSDETAIIRADSFSFVPNTGGTTFKVAEYGVMTGGGKQSFIEYNTITGTSQTELFMNGSSAVFVIPSNANRNFEINISAYCTDAGNGVGISTGDAYNSWHLGGIKRVVNTTSIVGSVQTPATAQSDAGMSTSVVTIDADDSDESLRIRFTPPSTAGSTTIINVFATVVVF